VNFFQAQSKARHNTRLLSLLFIGAVLSLVVLTNLLVLLFFVDSYPGATLAQRISDAPQELWLYTSLGVIGLIAVASGFKYLALQGGGKAVAESLGGVLIHQNTADPAQRQLLNVVEEMAIAAGVPVPPVYLIRESSINAFAAGFGIHDAVIGINQGTIDLLNRQELQGVVAHEFSHILNGDMRINLRIIALLNGILILGIIGGALMRGSMFSRSRERGGLIALGLALLVIGYGGTFFGQLIKAAVSRQREFLADASAVQFTRSTQGIANALKKIRNHSTGSRLDSPQADENSHLFFGAIRSFSSMMATHPPLEARIKALDPQWQPSDSQQTTASNTHSSGMAANASSFAGQASHLSQHCGSANLPEAQRMLEDAEPVLSHASHDTFEARAMVYAMLLSADESTRSEQLALINRMAEPGVPALIPEVYGLIQQQSQRQKLLYLDQAMPTLKAMSRSQYKRFYELIGQLIVADGNVDLLEWVIHRIITQELYAHFVGPFRNSGHIARPAKVRKEVTVVLSLMAAASSTDQAQRQQAFQAGMEIWGDSQRQLSIQYFDYQALNQALDKLRHLNAALKAQLLDACGAAVAADGQLRDNEFALIKGIATTLDCPMPPLEAPA
jgi:Zn-dependent protease with chaperone function